jgi:hypothetical protein
MPPTVAVSGSARQRRGVRDRDLENGAIMPPREKQHRGTSLTVSDRLQRLDLPTDRENEMLRSLVRILAREAACEAFLGALAQQRRGGAEDDE